MALRTVAAVALVALAGCTHRQLVRSTALTAGTVMDIHHRMVLSNLALLSCHPEALPSHVRLEDGVVQVNDEAAFGTSGGFTALDGTGFGIEQYGPAGSRQVTEQWGIDAVTDPRNVKVLQDLYRAALGLPPLPDPAAVAYAGQEPPRDDGKKDSENGSSSDSPSPVSPGGGGSTLSGGDSESDRDREVPVAVLLRDVPPPGWFHVGCKGDVPKSACHVGRYGDCYVWVTAEGVPELSRFTLTVLAATKFRPGERRSRGLAVTR